MEILGLFSMFSRSVLGLLSGFVFALKVLQAVKCLMEFLCGFGEDKASELRRGFCPNCGFGEVHAANSLEDSQSSNANYLVLNQNIKAEATAEEKFEGGSDESVCYNEDEEFDVLALRKLVKIERERRNEVRAELEKERTACASAVEEAMAMILRLQNEKSSIEIEANQCRRMAEQKQQYDKAVIQSLEWLIMKKGILEASAGRATEDLRSDEMAQSKEAASECQPIQFVHGRCA